MLACAMLTLFLLQLPGNHPALLRNHQPQIARFSPIQAPRPSRQPMLTTGPARFPSYRSPRKRAPESWVSPRSRLFRR